MSEQRDNAWVLADLERYKCNVTGLLDAIMGAADTARQLPAAQQANVLLTTFGTPRIGATAASLGTCAIVLRDYIQRWEPFIGEFYPSGSGASLHDQFVLLVEVALVVADGLQVLEDQRQTDTLYAALDIWTDPRPRCGGSYDK